MDPTNVLLISRHHAFAETVRRQLGRIHAEVEILPPWQFEERIRSGPVTAEVAFVDLDAEAPDGTSLFQTLGSVAKDCQVILVCHPWDIPLAVDAARRWEVFDYVLLDSISDPYRAAMLVERARSHCLPDLPEVHGHEKQRHRRILSSLMELRSILKSREDHPVVDAIARYRSKGRALTHVDGEWLAGVYQDCLIDVICGRLKRLELEFHLHEEEFRRGEDCPERPEILVVEDSEICADIAQHILENNGLDVRVAPTAELAKIELEKRTPSLIVMDVHLGAANGLRLVETLRQRDRFHDVPIIVCSADRMAATVKLAARLNIQGYLVKPYVPNVLVTKVKNVLAQSTLEALLAKHEPMDIAP